MYIHLSQHICWKTIFSPLNSLNTLVEKQLTIIGKIYFWTFNPIQFIHLYMSLYQYHIVLATMGFTYVLKSRSWSLLALLFFFKIVSVILGPMHFHISFNMSVNFCRMIGIVLNLQQSVWVVLPLDDIKSSNPSIWGVFPFV